MIPSAISQENVDKARGFIEAYNRRDFDAALKDFDPDVDWVLPDQQSSDSGRGTGAVLRFFEDIEETFDDLRLPGVRFEAVTFTPTSDVYARSACGGVRLLVTDREAIRPVTVGLSLARVLRERYRDQYKPEGIQNLLVNRSTMWAFLRGEPLPRVIAWAEMARTSFLNRRASYLIYR